MSKPTTKKCPRCDEEKPATYEFFGVSNSRKDGLFPYCKPCRTQQGRETRANKRKSNRLPQHGKPLLALMNAINDMKTASPSEKEAAKLKIEDVYNQIAIERQKLLLRISTLEMSDSYIARILTRGTDLKTSEVPKVLIKAKRQQLTMQRFLKEEL